MEWHWLSLMRNARPALARQESHAGLQRAAHAFLLLPAGDDDRARRARVPVEDLPGDLAALAAVAQGLIINEHLAAAYGVTLSDANRATVHVRRVADLLERIVATDSRPLTQARAPPPGWPGTAGISPS